MSRTSRYGLSVRVFQATVLEISTIKERFGPHAVLRCYAADKDDPTEQSRWGRVGKQCIEDTGPHNRKRMETCDDEFVAAANDFINWEGAFPRSAVGAVEEADPVALITRLL